MPDTGTVYLVGAGPGDPGLLTLRGRECLAQADVVVYDNLAGTELLDHVPAGSERIYVGKQASRHTMKQDEINALLVARAKDGNAVVRLKGGDPFVFGRGAEEALALMEEKIPFEIVPGVTAGVAGAAYAGIPVTHRAFNSVLTFITGHEDPDKEKSAINWTALAAGGGTLLFYMGVKNLENIAHKLVEGGRSPDTPVAVIQWGTLPAQRVIEGTLSDITERVAAAGLVPPAIIVVGDVVKLRAELDWYERRPLFGKRIVVTRTRTQASELAAKLQLMGAQPLLFPTIRIEQLDDTSQLKKVIDTISDFDWLVFTSPNAVEAFFSVLHTMKYDSRRLASSKICVIGPGTEARLNDEGIISDLMPEKFTSAGVFDAFVKSKEVDGKHFLLPRADIANPELPRRLREAGAVVTEVTAYRTLPGEPEPKVIDALRDGKVDAVTFTSSSTARNFAALVRDKPGGLPEDVTYASIGPETSKSAAQEGMEIKIEAAEHTINGLVTALVEYFG